jgi:hypothetical protein
MGADLRCAKPYFDYSGIPSKCWVNSIDKDMLAERFEMRLMKVWRC